MKLGTFLIGVCGCLSAIAVPPSAVRLGNEGGAGGDGVVLDGKTYLLDLVENGIEEQAYIDESMKNTPAFTKVRARVATALQTLHDDAVVDGVTEKLLEVGQVSTPFAYLLLNVFEEYRWALVAPALVPIEDEESPLDLGTQVEKVQLAIRKIYQVYINRELWKKLPPVHRVALLFHEITYAVARPDFLNKTENGVTRTYNAQSSAKARQLVGYIFTEDHYTPGKHIPFTELSNLGRTLMGSELPWSLFGLDYEIYDVSLGDIRHIAYGARWWIGGTVSTDWGTDRTAVRDDASVICAEIPWDKVQVGYGDRVRFKEYEENVKLTRDSFLNKNGQRMYYVAVSHQETHWYPEGSENVFDLGSCVNTYRQPVSRSIEFWKGQQSIFRLPNQE